MVRNKNGYSILVHFIVPRNPLVVSGSDNYKNEVIGFPYISNDHDKVHSGLYRNKSKKDFSSIIERGNAWEEFIDSPKAAKSAIRNVSSVRKMPLSVHESAQNAKTFSVLPVAGVPATEDFRNSENIPSKRTSLDNRPSRRMVSIRSSKKNHRNFKGPMSLSYMEMPFRQAARKARRQKLKSSISAPISSSDIQKKVSLEPASSIDTRINIGVAQNLEEIGFIDQRPYIKKKRKRNFFKNNLLRTKNRRRNELPYTSRYKVSDLYGRFKIPNVPAKKGVNHNQKFLNLSHQKPFPLFGIWTYKDDNFLTSDTFGGNSSVINQNKLISIEKISQKYQRSFDSQEYQELVYNSSRSLTPISDNPTLERTTELPSLELNAAQTIASASTSVMDFSAKEDLEILSSSPLAQSTPRLHPRYFNKDEEKQYKISLDLSFNLKSFYKRPRYLEEQSLFEQATFWDSSKQEYDKRENLKARSQDLKMMKKHPSPSKFELDRLRQALGRVP